MANFTVMKPVFFIQGDGASTTFQISLTKTPILFDRYTMLNFPRACDGVDILIARDANGVDVTSHVSVSTSGTLVTITFNVTFTTEWEIHLRFLFST